MKERPLPIFRSGPFRSLFLPLIICMALLNMLDLKAQVAFASNMGHPSVGQQVKETENRISLQVNNELLGHVLERIEQQTPFVFVYSNDEIKAAQKISLNVKD